jgi:hypothetical protein
LNLLPHRARPFRTKLRQRTVGVRTPRAEKWKQSEPIGPLIQVQISH